ncbi:MINDY deubiquitinase [Nakaseomyces glabratus]
MDDYYSIKSIEFKGYHCRILLDQDEDYSALVALTNALVLSQGHNRVTSQLKSIFDNCNEIAVEDLLDELANIGLQLGVMSNYGQDKEQLIATLKEFRKGLHINPKFNGSFTDSLETSVFSGFNVALVHGWVVDGDRDPTSYYHLSKYSYEEAQRVLVQAYEIRKDQNGVALNTNAQQVLDDSAYIKSFLARSATQLTGYGLQHLKEILVEKSFAVLFRNDRYFTLYKNAGELFILVTNPSQSRNNNIVWQSLHSVNGARDLYYNGVFVEINPDNDQNTFDDVVVPQSNPFSDPQTNQEFQNIDRNDTFDAQQVEDDELLARQLQEEEDRQAAGLMQDAYRRNGPRNKYQIDDESKKKKKRNSIIPKMPSLGKKKKDGKDKNCIIM